MQRDLIDAIKQFPLRSYRRGETILQAGQGTNTLYAIRDGFAQVGSVSQRGTMQLVWIAGRYDIIPTESLFRSRGELRFSYGALTELQAYEIPKQDFLALCDESPSIIREVAMSMSSHYDDLLTRLQAVEQSGIRDKLVHTLHSLASRFSSDSVVNLNSLGLQLSHQDIANMVGATRETTAIELKRMKDEGLIDYDRKEFSIFTDKLDALM